MPRMPRPWWVRHQRRQRRPGWRHVVASRPMTATCRIISGIIKWITHFGEAKNAHVLPEMIVHRISLKGIWIWPGVLVVVVAKVTQKLSFWIILVSISIGQVCYKTKPPPVWYLIVNLQDRLPPTFFKLTQKPKFFGESIGCPPNGCHLETW